VALNGRAGSDQICPLLKVDRPCYRAAMTSQFDPKPSFGSIRWTYELALDFGRPEREVATDRAMEAWYHPSIA
jgi:hypothetical protein